MNKIVNFLVPALYRTLNVFPAKFGKVREELRPITGSSMMPLQLPESLPTVNSNTCD
ncbi:hypothetical protein [Candidatus Seongchinamella marina]|uniref:hypothetical protein n=1 Tax=Candidatus Seongchinamella marina TaxID=2518990 RepID=UPI00242AFFF2|nr:hypothetical protein [Candidatus Seongchinamella marina]